MQKKIQLILIAMIGIAPFLGAQTVGLFQNSEAAYNGYTLLEGTTTQRAFLIDNCGEKVNEWTFQNRPGLMSYLTPEGNLLRTERISGFFGAGGAGGKVVLYDWDSNPLWFHDFNTNEYKQHHDIELLPNGNFLMILWVSHTGEEAIAQGRDPMLLNGKLWSERIQEIEILNNNQINVVWEWNLWDHLVQDFSADKPNYGNVLESPHKMNLNYTGASNLPLGFAVDWVHLNGISYNAELDQIVVSSRHLGEMWIIDHSTTTEEAKTSTGGNANKGGDILYRWGNSEVYDRGNAANQKSFGQHDVQWAKVGADQTRGLLLFNNGVGRPGPDHSQVELLELPLDGPYNYRLEGEKPFGPEVSSLVIDEIEQNSFYSSNVSGVQMQPNGNLLVTVGSKGLLVEVDTITKENHWKYIFPMDGNDIVSQGVIANNNYFFKTRRYPTDFSGFEGKDLQPQGPIELNPLPSTCDIYSATRDVQNKNINLKVFPNPAAQTIYLSPFDSNLKQYAISNVMGKIVRRGKLSEANSIDIASLSSGIYFLKLDGYVTQKFVVSQ